MYKLASMPDLSSLVDLEVKGLPSGLKAWEDGGRKAFPRVECASDSGLSRESLTRTLLMEYANMWEHNMEHPTY